MATVKALPLYQRKHKHFDQDYRSLQTKYTVKEYAASSSRKTSSKTETHHQQQEHQGTSNVQAVEAVKDESTYTIPPFRQRDAAEVEEYQRRTINFGRGLAELQQEVHKMREATRYQVERIVVQREVEEAMSFRKKIYEETVKEPEFLVNVRAHTVWEKTPLKLLCTVLGHPAPIVKWFKNGVLIDRLNNPDKYKLESKYGVHSLTIARSDIGDTGEYTAVATNVHGSVSSKATVTVKRPGEEEELPQPSLISCQIPLLSEIRYSKLDITFLEKFGVTFGTEGGTVSLTCKLIINPDLVNLPPDAMWYRDDELLKESEWVELKCGGSVAKLTLPHLNKEDEGLYTLRMWTKEGTTEHSAYLFVKDAAAPVAGAPPAPMDVKILDVNRDYVFLSWKPPNTTTEGPITGYFVDRLEVGTETWVQCNSAPVKICRYPVPGLSEGHAYQFRVRAANSSGISHPSRVSETVTTQDPTELERLQVIKIEGRRDIVIRPEDLEGYVKVPGPPTKVLASEISKSYVVLSWEPPQPRGREPLCYQIEKSVGDCAHWQRLNIPVPLKSPRFPIFDLEDNKKYFFRVTSVNKYGSSEASAPTEPVEKKEPYGVPSAPGQVAATRNTKTSVFVQWDPPKNPHGLIGYYIDGCVLGTKAWTPCNHRPYKYTRFVVHGLTPGDTYVFRVQAVNAFGLSDESQESLPIQVADALSTPTPAYGIALLCCDGASMILGWKRPRYSGGSKIAGYYVDQHEASSMEWKEVNVVPVKERTLKVENLKEGAFYEFKVKAANLAGVGQSSENSELFHCEAWNMPEPGPCHDISFCEIRNDSLVVQWKPPVYMGKSAVTGYLIEVSKKGTGQWAAVNDKSVDHCYLKVSELEKGETYVFRVRAVNAQGIGRASDASEPVCVKALPGTKEIHCGVDEETGDVYLSFEACEVSEVSKFIWSKSYKDITNSSRVTIETKGRRSKLIFKNPDKEDLGTYSVFVTDTENVSASTVLKEEELNKMLELSYAIRHPIVPLKTELAYEVLERGRVRFWLQAARMSPAVSYRFIANDKQITTSEGYKLSHNVETGIIELMMERFTKESEGTYTIQIEDGKAKNQSSLLLIGDAFKVALKEAEFQRKEYIRKQGPHFQDYLYFQVEEDCTVLLKCKLANVKKETVFHWYKDDEEIVLDTPVNVMSGSCALPIPLFSRKDQGIYKATLSDDRGKDVSLFDISGKVFEDIINGIAHIAGSSASELVLQCTPEGIRLQCYMKYYTEEMKTHWFHKESKISSSEKMRIGGTSEMAWMQICEPSDREKGHYTIEILDGTTSHTRTFDLSGQAYNEAHAEFQRLKAAAFAEKNRGRVVGGLPDVVTIMEKKTLSLTCTIWGDPTPEVTWFKNEQEVIPDDHILISFEGGKFSSLTIKCVTSEDSGKYSINVRNKYGGEFVEITVSVYRQGEEIPEPKLGQRPGGAVAAKSSPQASQPAKSPMPPPQSAKSPTPTPSVKSPTPSSGARSPTPRQEAKSPTPPRNVKSPTPPRRK
ncbi:M-protein, striated muscle [Paramormyrops kingsleyae]|uniref:Myomesin 2a n=1 Tax=Paramormyrops kingsleyae TaxID=1676925 RepID=A0A3B3S911_9TELE|nr:M-protein, striated muscle-like [Paramormyrops kingsleyae]